MNEIACPSCRQPMHQQRFERLQFGEVALDLCFTCQGIWFDDFESVQMTPGGIIELFKLLHQQRDEIAQPLRDPLYCPRCNERLLHGLDVAKYGGRFNYHRCLQKHGRFITFAQFMIEKGFVRQLAGSEIEALSAKIGTIRCNGCGAPIDIRKEHVCGHCHAPIAILDPQAVEQALARYQDAEVKRSAVNVDALGDAIVMREREKSREARARATPDNAGLVDVVDLIGAGIEMVWTLIRR